MYTPVWHIHGSIILGHVTIRNVHQWTSSVKLRTNSFSHNLSRHSLRRGSSSGKRKRKAGVCQNVKLPLPAGPRLLRKAREEECVCTCNDVNVQITGVFRKLGECVYMYMHTKTVSARFFSPSLEEPTYICEAVIRCIIALFWISQCCSHRTWLVVMLKVWRKWQQSQRKNFAESTFSSRPSGRGAWPPTLPRPPTGWTLTTQGAWRWHDWQWLSDLATTLWLDWNTSMRELLTGTVVHTPPCWTHYMY